MGLVGLLIVLLGLIEVLRLRLGLVGLLIVLLGLIEILRLRLVGRLLRLGLVEGWGWLLKEGCGEGCGEGWLGDWF